MAYSQREPPYYLRSGLGNGIPAAITAAMIMQTMTLEWEAHEQQAYDHDRLAP